MGGVLVDARLAIRGLGTAAFVDRLMAAFSADGSLVPALWRGKGEWGFRGLVSTFAHSGPFDVSPRLDPRTRRYDVVHYASNLTPVIPGNNSVVTVHDLMHRRWSQRRSRRMLGAMLERGLPRAGRVVAISDRTRREVEETVPGMWGRVEVIPHGMRTLPVLPAAERRHVLAFGGQSDARKRTDFMVSVYESYRRTTADPLPLVVLARAGLTPGQARALGAMGARVVGDASSAEVDTLMAASAALLYPTAEEGFGLPILEAAEAATPVVIDGAAAVASEVVGGHCFRANGRSVDTWVAALRRAIAGVPAEHGLALPSWSVVASRYRSLYAEVLERG